MKIAVLKYKPSSEETHCVVDDCLPGARTLATIDLALVINIKSVPHRQRDGLIRKVGGIGWKTFCQASLNLRAVNASSRHFFISSTEFGNVISTETDVGPAADITLKAGDFPYRALSSFRNAIQRFSTPRSMASEG